MRHGVRCPMHWLPYVGFVLNKAAVTVKPCFWAGRRLLPLPAVAWTDPKRALWRDQARCLERLAYGA